MAELATRYLGLELRNPVVASAGPISQSLDGIRSLADAGVGAVVMYSLFEEQVRRATERDAEIALLTMEYEQSFSEAMSFLPNLDLDFGDGSEPYLQLVEAAAGAVDVPVIASLNGAAPGTWTAMARRLADAGASALELNIYFVPGDMSLNGRQVEDRHLAIVHDVKQSIGIPVAVKLSPFFSSIGNLCTRLDLAGADGLVLFNRFLQPDIDLDRLVYRSGVTLSSPIDARLARTWIALLHGRLDASLAATSGVENPEDVIKYILAGADVVMTTSSLIRHGAAHATKLIHGLDAWLDGRGLSLDAARGLLSVPDDVDAAEFERGGYVSALLKAKEIYGSLR